MGGRLPDGAYDQLITEGLAALFEGREDTADVDGAELTEVLAAHLEKIAARVLDALPKERRLAVVNEVVERLGDPGDLVAAGPEMLLAIGPPPARPRNPLRRADLLINARHEPALHEELAAEIASADRIDLLCAFVKWQGLRLLVPAIEEYRRAGKQLRVITTTYVGATERRAVDELARLGAEVKISYETRTTRLHAKAWLFRRTSGWDTGYVGSSNLSRSALVDGLEWNVRLSRGDTPVLLDKFGATFDSYWADPRFEPYDPEADAGRLDEALRVAHGPTRSRSPGSRCGLTTTSKSCSTSSTSNARCTGGGGTWWWQPPGQVRRWWRRLTTSGCARSWATYRCSSSPTGVRSCPRAR